MRASERGRRRERKKDSCQTPAALEALCSTCCHLITARLPRRCDSSMYQLQEVTQPLFFSLALFFSLLEGEDPPASIDRGTGLRAA